MKIAANFNERVVVHYNDVTWLKSPMPGVERKPLDRVGEEIARATSIVKYAPGSRFSPHIHTGGEEFVVLEGVFQDEHGDFPVGSYIRNPPGSSHTPRSDDGCTIFVKLWQFQPEDSEHLRVQMVNAKASPLGSNEHIQVTPLYEGKFEKVSLLRMDANTRLVVNAIGGAELLVMAGEATEKDDTLVKHSWLRCPINSELTLQSGANGASIWLKTDHLKDVDKQIARVSLAV
ncbi:cupin domain-containing protein [Glaciecola petra]|uniref:Cupin domain-containing protein n=1 Tax=Glaciecola petra TaxID=3075602 RepID=A0ABU2ZSS2_9ALTE|nr:cupin domain-containing protein [Aestuariibacter sp. P117]MDT0595301.1 cupin domain-containing protein [Aestuariibacter sp. P117]